MKYQIDYKSFYDDSPDMLFSVDAETGNIIECNDTLVTNLGYTKKEVIGMNIVEMYHPDDMERVKENFNSFKHAIECVVSISKQNEGWIKSLAK